MDPSPFGSEPPKVFATKRFKFIWRILLISNLGLGAYMFANARKKDVAAIKHKGAKSSTVDVEGTKPVKVEDAESSKAGEELDPKGVPELFALRELTDAVGEQPVSPAAVATEPVKVPRKPIPEDEQRELLKWILEEKRKAKPKDREEKKMIDEEKAILKQFIRAEKIPKFIPDDSFDSSLRDWDKFFSQ